MGGFGSGRSGSGAPTCEGCHSVDLAWLRRRGMLAPGRSSTLTWSRAGEQTGSITLVAQQEGVRLIYRTKDRDGAPVDVSELVAFVYTPTRFGGRRQWLRCLKCGRGCRTIYVVAKWKEIAAAVSAAVLCFSALLPLPTVLPPAICLAERKTESARLGPGSQNRQALA